MSFDARDENGNQLQYKLRFVDENRAEASGGFSDAKGNVIVKIRWKQTRREPSKE